MAIRTRSPGARYQRQAGSYVNTEMLSSCRVSSSAAVTIRTDDSSNNGRQYGSGTVTIRQRHSRHTAAAQSLRMDVATNPDQSIHCPKLIPGHSSGMLPHKLHLNSPHPQVQRNLETGQFGVWNGLKIILPGQTAQETGYFTRRDPDRQTAPHTSSVPGSVSWLPCLSTSNCRAFSLPTLSR